MRPCQICQNDSAIVINHDYQGYLFCECQVCGHRFVDSLELSQASLDQYYLHIYKTDDKAFLDARLNSLAECVKHYSMRVLDIGGMDGELQGRLNKIGVICDVAGVGDNQVGRYDGVILSHTLEHIYDISQMMDRIKSNLTSDGFLFIEVPIHPDPYLPPLEYDYGWQHINKFRPNDLTGLCHRHGFDVVESTTLPDYVNELHNRRYHCWRVVARHA